MFSPKRWLLAILLLNTVLFTAAPAVAAPRPFEVDVTISGLGGFDLGAFDLNVNYDDALLAVDSYTLTGELGSFAGPDPAYPDAADWSLGDDSSGIVNLAVISYLEDFSTQPDAFTLATLTFTGDSTGLADISLSDIILSDDFGDPISFTVSGTDINAVPIPGAALLLGSGLVGIVGLRRRARK
ncbi:MAG: hypothetical protein JJV98_19560 [Desulfosarcina sp.]|nr:hypothetical protein [Desulfobacterales bacterium]